MVGDDLTALSDPELVILIAGRDEAALGTVYDRHGGMLYGAALRFLGDRQAAEEVVQDVFLVLWREAARYDQATGALAGWLLRIARNRAIDRLRAAARRPALVAPVRPLGAEASWVPDGPARLVDPAVETAPGPEDQVAQAWLRAVVRTALSTMPADERRALELAYDQELTQAEIADLTGWPLGTVKSRTRRALASLRAALEGVPGLQDAGGLSTTAAPAGDRPRWTAPPGGGFDAAR